MVPSRRDFSLWVRLGGQFSWEQRRLRGPISWLDKIRIGLGRVNRGKMLPFKERHATYCIKGCEENHLYTKWCWSGAPSRHEARGLRGGLDSRGRSLAGLTSRKETGLLNNEAAKTDVSV